MTRPIITLLSVPCLLVNCLHAQLSRIVLEASGGPALHTDLATAISSALPGYKLYLSGGTFNVTGDPLIDKGLHFIGADSHPDSTNVSAATSNNCTDLRITTGANGISFTRIAFNPSCHTYHGLDDTDRDRDGIIFRRCEFEHGISHRDHQFRDDLYLQSMCSGVHAGTDRTYMGIYGTDSPYKEGVIPHTPHFRSMGICPGTNAAGNLPVNAHAAAQTN